MDWAKDFEGKIVRARKASYLGFDLRCPTCEEPVYLRAGSERRPHFAHYSNRAKPDCENYYPSTEILQKSFPKTYHINSELYPKVDSLRCGLFLGNSPNQSSFTLFLRLPSLASLGNIEGTLEIQHALGTKLISARVLNKAFIQPLSPKVPLIDCTGTGDLVSLSDHLESQIAFFSNGMNLFSATEGGGRFMYPQETLEWGKKYWVVTEAPITVDRSLLDVIEWAHKGKISNWSIYETKLPATIASSRFDEIEKIIAIFFDRDIRAPRPRAHIVYPLPHHIAQDGAYVYSQAPKIIYVRRSTNHEVTIEGPDDLIGPCVIRVINENWIEIQRLNLSTQDVVLTIKGVEQAILRLEDCDLIQPNGMIVMSNELSWDLHSDSPLANADLYSNELIVECGSLLKATYVAKNNNSWVQSGTQLHCSENSEKWLYAGGFGQIKPRSGSESEIAQGNYFEINPNGTYYQEIWIKSLVRKRYGQSVASLVQNFIENPSDVNMGKLGQVLVSSLMAYIRTAANNRKSQTRP